MSFLFFSSSNFEVFALCPINHYSQKLYKIFSLMRYIPFMTEYILQHVKERLHGLLIMLEYIILTTNILHIRKNKKEFDLLSCPCFKVHGNILRELIFMELFFNLIMLMYQFSCYSLIWALILVEKQIPIWFVVIHHVLNT